MKYSKHASEIGLDGFTMYADGEPGAYEITPSIIYDSDLKNDPNDPNKVVVENTKIPRAIRDFLCEWWAEQADDFWCEQHDSESANKDCAEYHERVEP